MIDRKKIIINADDFGYSVAKTDGIIRAFEIGLLDRTTIMVNMPDCDRAVKLAFQKNLNNFIGLHLNLTTGKPLTDKILDCPNLSKHGVFNPELRKYIRKNKLSEDEKEALKQEIGAQIQKYKEYGFTLMHIDSHHHIHVERQILNLLLPLATEFTSMRIARNLMQSKIRRLYKWLINRRIRKNFETTEFFGGYFDFIGLYKRGTLEIMTHPEINEDGVCQDRVANSRINNISDYRSLFKS